MSENRLDKCAHCGGDARLTVDYVYCTKCGMQTAIHESQYKAIEVWNHRSPVKSPKVLNLDGIPKRMVQWPDDGPVEVVKTSDILTCGYTDKSDGTNRTSQDWQREIVDWADSQGFETWASDHREVLRNLCSWLGTQLATVPILNREKAWLALQSLEASCTQGME